MKVEVDVNCILQMMQPNKSMLIISYSFNKNVDKVYFIKYGPLICQNINTMDAMNVVWSGNPPIIGSSAHEMYHSGG